MDVLQDPCLRVWTVLYGKLTAFPILARAKNSQQCLESLAQVLLGDNVWCNASMAGVGRGSNIRPFSVKVGPKGEHLLEDPAMKLRELPSQVCPTAAR